MSKSSAKTATSSTTSNESTNINLQDVSGPAVGSAGGDVSITTTDHGALDAATELGGAAFSLGEKAIDSNLKAVDSSLDFGGVAIDAVKDVNDRSLDFGESALGGAFSFGKEALAVQADTAKQTTNTLSDAIERAAAASRSDSSQSLDKITKAGMIVGVALAAVAAAYFLFKK